MALELAAASAAEEYPSLSPQSALARHVGLERVVVSTYQSVSGTGVDALAELESQIAGDASPPRVYPHPIAFNVVPQVDDFVDGGYTREERKLVHETRKIMDLPELRLTATTVRVRPFSTMARPMIPRSLPKRRTQSP